MPGHSGRLNVGLLILVGAATLRVQRLIWHGPV
jgi:hypothetical protein